MLKTPKPNQSRALKPKARSPAQSPKLPSITIFIEALHQLCAKHGFYLTNENPDNLILVRNSMSLRQAQIRMESEGHISYVLIGQARTTRHSDEDRYGLAPWIMNWLAELETLVKNGTPNDGVKVTQLIALAENWPTCACGELCLELPRSNGGAPLDDMLYDLGRKFYEQD